MLQQWFHISFYGVKMMSSVVLDKSTHNFFPFDPTLENSVFDEIRDDDDDDGVLI